MRTFLNYSLEPAVPEGTSEQFAVLVARLKANMVTQLAKNDRTPVEVIPGLYIGSVASIIFSNGLKAAGITHTVMALKGVKPLHVSPLFGSRLLSEIHKNARIG